ncbi:MAG: DUF4331 domain-containing protein [Chloroflexaceae bacterium]|jgi:hypothetical protein|nr:DUF4331 domain-containing protein [Chloroflexaceae bacterium]
MRIPWFTRQRLAALLTPFVLVATVLVGSSSAPVGASSHREAPLISKDPTVDNVDVYAFVSPDAPSTVTLAATWIPFEEPGGGPNFYHFDSLARYNIKVDRDGDAKPDVTYEWRFSPLSFRDPNSFLYNKGPINNASDTTLNITQYYTVTEILGDNDTPSATRTVLFSNRLMVPDNIGPASTPNYTSLASQFINTGTFGGDAIKEFTGQRDDPFFVDVNSIFDLGILRPFANLHLSKQRATPGLDSTAGFNVHANILQIPIKRLAPACPVDASGVPTDPSKKECVIGVWSTAERPTTITRAPGSETGSGPFVQVSRLGMPLTNEVVIPLALKDAFNGLKPEQDQPTFVASTVLQNAVLKPELATLLPVLYPGVFSASNLPAGNRTDLFTIFLTGVPGVNQQVNSGNPLVDNTKIASEQLRLNMALKPNALGACFAAPLGKPADSAPSRLGALEGDLCGFPNGRRLTDDVTDIALRAVAGGYGPILGAGCPTSTGGLLNLTNCAPGNALGDGVDRNDRQFLTSFPYLATPHAGYNRIHAFITELWFPSVFNNAR